MHCISIIHALFCFFCKLCEISDLDSFSQMVVLSEYIVCQSVYKINCHYQKLICGLSLLYGELVCAFPLCTSEMIPCWVNPCIADKAQQPRENVGWRSMMFHGCFLLIQFNTKHVLSDVRHGTSIPNIQLSFRKKIERQYLREYMNNQVIVEVNIQHNKTSLQIQNCSYLHTSIP